jgi:hypothetical protein
VLLSLLTARSHNVTVPYSANLGAQRLISGPTNDVLEASALSYHTEQNFIYSASWGETLFRVARCHGHARVRARSQQRQLTLELGGGDTGPTDDGTRKEGPGPVLLAAMQEAITNGRNGKGTIYVWAGGNGGSRDNVNYDGVRLLRVLCAIALQLHIDHPARTPTVRQQHLHDHDRVGGQQRPPRYIQRGGTRERKAPPVIHYLTRSLSSLCRALASLRAPPRLRPA